MTKNNSVQTSKILKMFGAQSYGTLINTLDKLATVPLFLFLWGLELYGEWLILRAVPAYLAIAELGFATAAANRMSALLLEDNKKLALNYFQAVFGVLCCVSVLLVVTVLTVLLNVDIRHLFNFSSADDYNLLLVVILLLGYTLLVFQTQLLSAAYRAIGQYVYAAYFTYHMRAVELLAVVLVLIFGGGLFSAALSYFIIRLCGALIMGWLLIRKAPWIKYGFSSDGLPLIREMLPDAGGFLAFPLGQAMSLQGAVFVIANLFSPAVVALFSSSRTLSRTIVQFGMQINRSVWPEMTRLCAAGEKELARNVYFNASASFVWLGGIASAVLLVLAPLIFQLWTAGQMKPDIELFALLLLAALLNGFWYSALSILAATDRHKRVAIYYIVLSTLSLPLAYFLGVELGNVGVALAIVLAEIIMLVLVLRFSLKKIEASSLQLLQAAMMMPLNLFQIVKRVVHGR